MRLDAAATQHLMLVLTSLYSDPEGTVIREYSTNARDSHIMSGQTRPFEVTTPTPLTPYLKIKDYGLGLSVDEVREVFSLYGASTKRDTNEVAGMLGLGSKSALAYGETFTVVAIKDGRKAFVNVYRQEDGTGVMEIIDESNTNEPNGVEIVIPAKSQHNMKQRAEKFFRYWPKGLVLVNGVDVSKRDHLTEVVPGLFVDHLPDDFNYYSDAHSYVMMGGVTYPIDNNYGIGRSVRRAHMSSVVIAEVPIGEIDFTPSREALMYTSRTKNWLSNIEKTYTEHIRAIVVKEIEDAGTAADALKLWKNAKQYYQFSVDDVRWQGKHDFPDYRQKIDGGWLVRYAQQYRRGSYSENPEMQIDSLIEVPIVFDNFDVTRPAPRDFERMSIYFQQNNITEPARYYFYRQTLDVSKNVWLQAVKVVDWKTIKAIKLPTKPRAPRGTVAEAYEVWDKADSRWKDRPLQPGEDIIYLNPSDERERLTSASPIQKIFPGHAIVRVYANRQDKMVRNNPKAKHLNVAARAAADIYIVTLTSEEKFFVHAGSWSQHTFKNLARRVSEIDDPAVVRMVTAATFDFKTIENFNALDRAYNTSININRRAGIDKNVAKNPLEKYVLWRENHLTESIEYANLKYAASLQTTAAAV